NRTLKAQLAADAGSSAPVQFVFASSTAIGPTDQNITGFERMISVSASYPTVPVPPLARTAEALSSSAIRWHFIDLSNNEFGFKILDYALKIIIQKDESDLSYIDETGLQQNTNYSGRRIYGFNDRGQSSYSDFFPSVFTLAEIPSVITAEDSSINKIKVKAEGGPTNLTSDKTGLYFENITANTNSGWIRDNIWISTGLTAGNEYEFRVKARNADGIETSWSQIIKLSTSGDQEAVVTPLPAPEPSPAPQPSEKPVSEMTAVELQAKITEIQQKIIEILSQLILLIQQQIAGI
ncbi:MAG: fibronectin type III domain-containing protein, partial [Candidatus Parcubacteria bacterium]|nr:fibronectin type III domain-containing protein [Candidatus Parcubacteria bacterium]